MADKAYLAVNALGTTAMFSPSGEQLVFRDGICILDAKNTSKATMHWLNNEGEASGIRLLDDAEVKAYLEAEEAKAKALEARAQRQAGIDAIIQGKDPELIPAAKADTSAKPTINAASSVQQKLAEAKAAAAKA